MNIRIKRGITWIALASVVSLAAVFPAVAQSFTNLHSLQFTNGTGPVAGLLLSGNVIYGTARTDGGGAAGGLGSVFKMNTDGSGFTNLHTFSTTAPDGEYLYGDLVLSGGALYSTAFFGGATNYGCVFSIGTNGLGLTNIYSFTVTSANSPYTNADGAYPQAGLVLAGGTFYGTASSGGVKGWGTIFAVNTNGSGFTNLHNFNITNGQLPSADLILSGATLYGMTPDGGTAPRGTIFSINTNGTGFTNIYSFTLDSGSPATNSDGASPLGSLVLSVGTLYGTTSEGGLSGNGTIFAVSTNGTNFSVLHQFSATSGTPATNSDGAAPNSGLTLVSNILYGTASKGGAGGCGTIFQVNRDGSGFTTLYSFSTTNAATGTNTDGAFPIGGLVASGAKLYGTTSAGGDAGYGTIFSITVPPTLNIALAGTNVVLSWASNIAGFNLQSSTSITSASWNAVAGQYVVTNAVSPGQKFYRLKSP